MPDALVYRAYRPDDLDALVALDDLCFDARFRFSRRAMQRYAEASNAIALVAQADEVIAGFCIAHVEPARTRNVAYCVTLDVREVFRRSGIAGGLLHRAEDAARRFTNVMMLHVFERNEPAIRFYESRGYRRSQLAPHFYGESINAFVYRKELDRGE